MAVGAIAGSRLANGQADQVTSHGGMAAGAGIVGLGRGADQGIVVTARATGTGDGDDPCMVRGGSVQPAPVSAVTGGAVAAGGEVLAHCAALQGAVGAMAVRTVLQVRLRSGADQGVVVAARTVGRGHLNQRSVVRGVGGMRSPPSGGVTGLAVSAGGEVLACRAAEQAAVGCTMAIRTVGLVR